MKTNTVILAAFAAAALLPGTPSRAQAPAPAARHQRGGGMQKMAAKLGLSDAQKAQLKTIADSARAQIKALHTPGTPPSDAQKAQIKAIRKDAKEKMLAVLTPAQREQLKAMRNNRKVH